MLCDYTISLRGLYRALHNIIEGSIVGTLKGDTRNVDYGSYPSKLLRAACPDCGRDGGPQGPQNRHRLHMLVGDSWDIGPNQNASLRDTIDRREYSLGHSLSQ